MSDVETSRSNIPKYRLLRRLGSATKTSLALVGGITIASFIYEYRQVKNALTDEIDSPQYNSEKKPTPKKALILPFHRMKIVERKKPDYKNILNALRASDDGEKKIIEIELRELVEIIHTAASDPEIVALYGTFGTGAGFDCGGYAHVEEIRNAIRVFNESHRQHYEPGVEQNDKYKKKQKTLQKKYSFAFADTFDNPLDSANKEYFLASAFTRIHLQPRGSMSLFGVSTSNLFMKGLFDKYGITCHVFKHGKYKNAPNILTEERYTSEHLENTKAIIQSINGIVHSSIADSRGLSDSLTPSTWNRIHNYGTMTADQSLDIGLVDALPTVNLLDEMLSSNSNIDTLNNLRVKYGLFTDIEKFRADQSISLTQYSSILSKRKSAKEKIWRIHEALRQAAEKSFATESLLSLFGFKAPYFNLDEATYHTDKDLMQSKDKVAVLTISGPINDMVAIDSTSILRKIKKENNISCIVLRIDSPGGSVTASEKILEEIKALPQPVICSFSNVAASGGYYIATSSNRIFASPTTLTGSIGVFGVKVDASKLAAREGVNSQHVGSGNHSSTYSIFQPLTYDMKVNISRNMDKVYSYFKAIVGSSRGLSPEEVEEIAQGRVFTGEQAKEVCLVDDIGGIDRTIRYAIKNHTKSGFADVEYWPKRRTLKERITGIDMDELKSLDSISFLRHLFMLLLPDDALEQFQNEIPMYRESDTMLNEKYKHVSYPAIMMTIDEKSALEIVSDCVDKNLK